MLDDESNVSNSTNVIVDCATMMALALVMVLVRNHDFEHVSLVDVLGVCSSLETSHRPNVMVASTDRYVSTSEEDHIILWLT